MTLPWAPEILSNPHASTVFSNTGNMLFNGLRVRLAIHTGTPTAIQVYMSCRELPICFDGQAPLHLLF